MASCTTTQYYFKDVIGCSDEVIIGEIQLKLISEEEDTFKLYKDVDGDLILSYHTYGALAKVRSQDLYKSIVIDKNKITEILNGLERMINNYNSIYNTGVGLIQEIAIYDKVGMEEYLIFRLQMTKEDEYGSDKGYIQIGLYLNGVSTPIKIDELEKLLENIKKEY